MKSVMRGVDARQNLDLQLRALNRLAAEKYSGKASGAVVLVRSSCE